MTTAPWDTSCVDWEAKLLAGLPLVPELPLFGAEAAKALRIFRRLRLPDVIGTPTMGEAAGPWFLAIVEALFGSYDVAAGRRMIQEVFLLVPKKNSKSSGAAMLMLTALIMNDVPAGEFLLVAPTKEIADISFKQAAGSIRLDQALTKVFHTQRHVRLITHRLNGATLQIKAADEDVITGGKAVGTLVDETHVFARKAGAAGVFVELRGGLATHPNGFMMQISTQSKEPPAGVFRAELGTARDVRDGRLRLPLLPVLYELPRTIAADGRWKERRYWPLVNPNLGRSVDEVFLANELVKAEREGAAALALYASQHHNVELGVALRTDRWAGAERWGRRADPALAKLPRRFDRLLALLDRCEVVVIGVDGGGLDDLFGLAVLGREPREIEIEVEVNGELTKQRVKPWLSWSHAWCHEGVLELRKSIASRLEDFKAAGELTIVGDELSDLGEIAAIVELVKKRGLLGGVAVDPAGLGEFASAMTAMDVTEENKLLVGIGQGYRMMNAIKTAERALARGTHQHCGSSLMAWCVGNVKIEPTATAIRATKQNAGDAKIDPWAALMNAVDLMSTNPEAGADIYAGDRELRFA